MAVKSRGNRPVCTMLALLSKFNSISYREAYADIQASKNPCNISRCFDHFKDASRQCGHVCGKSATENRDYATQIFRWSIHLARPRICTARLATMPFLEDACMMLMLLCSLRVSQSIQCMNGRICLQQLLRDFDLKNEKMSHRVISMNNCELTISSINLSTS